MTHLLILGGTTEATALAKVIAQTRLRATISYAGRVVSLRTQPMSTRVGGFGGVDGLVRYIGEAGVTHIVDATHPFAAQMSRNAKAACDRTRTPLCALTRPPWKARDGDDWQSVPDIDAAVAALSGPARRVFLAVGRQQLAGFAAQPQHHYLLRLVDQSDGIVLPKHAIEIARGPFTLAGDLDLMTRHRIEVVVTKNAGGTGARAKIDAARRLKLPVIMIDRPIQPERQDLFSPQDVLDWLAHSGVDLGV
ncbi:MAG: cobalt-precorrin-6A reductase [Pseudomonadota bacterium]